MSITLISVKYRVVVISLALLGLAAGVYQFINAPRREDPEFIIRACTVTSSWPGADAEKIENYVVEPLERTIEEIDEVKETESTTIAGFTTIKVTMEDYVTEVEQVCDKIRSRIAGLSLPEGVSAPYVNSNYGDTCAMVLSVYQIPGTGEEKFSMRDLEKCCENIRDELNHINDVALVKIMSAPKEAIYIEPDPGSWNVIDLSIYDIKQRVSNRNRLMPGGMINTGKNFYNVTVKGDLNVVDEINKTVVANNSNNLPVWLNSLGFKVKRDYVSPPTIITRYSNDKLESQRCILMYFTMKKKKNIIELGNLVRRKINEWEQTILPPNVKVGIVSDQPKAVEENISLFINNLLQSILILFVVAWLLIGFRVALIMGISIPVIVLISFALARLFGVQLESMSIASLIISLGMLVDCGIEICDNVHRLQEDGYKRLSSVVEGARQVIFPILIGTLTTVFAFLPMITIPGNMGEYIRSIPIVVSLTLLVSWATAITFTTSFTWLLLKPGTHSTPLVFRLYHMVLQLIGKTSTADTSSNSLDFYKRFLRWGMHNKTVVFTGMIALFAMTIFLLKMDIIKSDFIPSAGGKQFLVDIWLQEGVSIDQTSKVCKQVESLILKEIKSVEKDDSGQLLDNITSVVGESFPRFKLSAITEFPKSNFAQILVNLNESKQVKEIMDKVFKAASLNITDARINVKRLGLGPNVKYPVIIRITGENYLLLKKYSSQVVKILNDIPGTLDVHDGWGNLAPQINVIPDDEQSAVAGISRTNAANTLSAFFSGSLLTTFREGDHTVPVYFRLPYMERNNINKLKELYIEGNQGKVPLSAISKIDISFEPARVERFRQQRNMEVLSLVKDGVLANSIIKKALPKLEELQKKMPLGYRIEAGGTYEKSQEGSAHIANSMLVALALIIVCLLVYFNSIIKTLAVMVTLPLACTGAFLGLYIMNQPLGFFAQLGLLSLFGIVVNGAIVLFDFIAMVIEDKKHKLEIKNTNKYGGLTRDQFADCITEAASLRVRPIMLTVFTTIGGMLPLAVSGGPLFEPLATVIIFGLFYSTILTLVIMPIIYFFCVDRLKMKIEKSDKINEA